MEWTQFVLPAFVAIEILIILALYRYILRDWIIQKWEEKMDEEGWLVIRLEPVIDEIEDRTCTINYNPFKYFYLGLIGKMTAQANYLDSNEYNNDYNVSYQWISFSDKTRRTFYKSLMLLFPALFVFT